MRRVKSLSENKNESSMTLIESNPLVTLWQAVRQT